MNKYFSEIIGTPVLGHADGNPLALISDIIIHPDTGKIEAFWVKPLTLPISNAVIKSDSILEWKKNVYIKDDREIAEVSDIIRISEIITRNTFFVGNNVQNESGEPLGYVYDLDFDTTKLYLNNIYTNKSFLFFFKYEQRVFSFDSILKVIPEYILVKDVQEKKDVILIKDKPLMEV